MDFFKKTWVAVLAWCMIIVGVVLLLLGGTSAAEISKIPALVAGILAAIGALIIFVRDHIYKKEAEGK